MANNSLRRELRTLGAVMLGLGSMIGTGVFVSLGLAAGLAGPAVVLAVPLAGALALCNGLSSAQLAARFPVAGGTYEYAHRVGWAPFGLLAGVMFLIAKSASAATAVLALAAYLLEPFVGVGGLMIPAALALLVMLTVVVLEGLRRTNTVNTVIVAVTLLGLAVFVAVSLPRLEPDQLRFDLSRVSSDAAAGSPAPSIGWPDLLHAAALAFVAYTGYGRIATLGEEVSEPRRTIPRAILLTVLLCIVVYAAVALAAVGLAGPSRFAELARGGAPLQALAESAGFPRWSLWAITAAAVTAMLGVVLNLLLGLSRVALAMARRRHLPHLFARIDAKTATPGPAVVLVAVVIALLAIAGSIRAAWSLSAVTVLIYYAITNAAALRLPPDARLYPRIISWIGLIGCLGLAAFIEPIYWVAAAALIALTLVWHLATRRHTAQP
ncbi:MAG: APC family permease [Planctomycetota bacterium]